MSNSLYGVGIFEAERLVPSEFFRKFGELGLPHMHEP